MHGTVAGRGRDASISSPHSYVPILCCANVDLVAGGRSEVGRLVVITGLPGSGKTTLALDLAASLPAARMCPDDWMMASGIDL